MVRRNQTAEDSSPLISWLPTSSWINGNSADGQLPNYSAGSFRLTTSFGAKASFSFNGTGVWIYGAKRGNHGPYVGAIDGVASPQQSGYSATDDIRALLWSATNLSMGPHVATITNLMTDPNAPYLDVDNIVWETEVSDAAVQPVNVLDDADPSIVYSPPDQWTANKCDALANYVGTTCHITSSTKASVSYSFNGDAITVYGGVGPKYGPYTVTLNSDSPIQFTANGTNSNQKQIIYAASGLGPGNHTVKLSNNPSQIGDAFDVDSFQVMGGFPATATAGSSSKGSGTNIAVIVAPIVVALLLVAAGIFGIIFWRRRQRQRALKDDLDLGRDDDDQNNMRMMPTPYNIATNNSSSASQTPLNPAGGGVGQPVTNWQSQYNPTQFSGAGAAAIPATPSRTSDTFTHQQTAYTSADLTSSSGSGSGPSRTAGPPISAVGEKGGAMYTGPTVRNDASTPHQAGSPLGSQYYDAPPSYT